MSRASIKKDVRQPPKQSVAEVVATLKRMGSKRVRDGMARFAIPADKAFGIPVGEIRAYAKRLGRDHELAEELWDAEWYEARMLACFVAEPARVTSAQMDRWCRDFDSWAICDTACFHLFDRTPHAWKKIRAWSRRREEFEKRAAFALLASVALHDKKASDELFAESLSLVEQGASDSRNFVKKAVNWALRAIGKRSVALHADAVEVARQLSASPKAAPRWVGKDALRELTSPASARRMAAREKKAK